MNQYKPIADFLIYFVYDELSKQQARASNNIAGITCVLRNRIKSVDSMPSGNRIAATVKVTAYIHVAIFPSSIVPYPNATYRHSVTLLSPTPRFHPTAAHLAQHAAFYRKWNSDLSHHFVVLNASHPPFDFQRCSGACAHT